MIIDILEIWKNSLLKEQIALLPEKPAHYSDNVLKSAVTFPENTKVIFIQNKNNFTPVKFYKDLPAVKLTNDEEKIRTAMSAEILAQKNSNNYDGDNILISSVLFDTEKSIIYIEAKKTKYSLIACINRKKFDNNSPILQQDLYGAGAIVPLITEKDGHTILLQSSKYNKDTFSTAGGFVEAKNDLTILTRPDQSNLVEHTAQDELLEELLADKKFNPRIDYQILSISRILFRKPVNGRGFVEFIVPAILKCHHDILEKIVMTNEAPDRNEHTGIFKLINLNPEERQQDKYELWSKNTPGGRDIYPEIVSEASRIFNRKNYGESPQYMMPYSRGKTFPISFFQPSFIRERGINYSPENQNKIPNNAKR